MKLTFLILLFSLCLLSFIMVNKYHNYHPFQAEQLVNSTLARAAKVIINRYNLSSCGAGVAMPGGPIQELTLCFNTKISHTKDELRNLLVRSAHELLNEVNKNQDIQNFLKAQPFTIQNIEIIIYNHDKNGREVYDPEISTADISQGILTYQTVDPNDTFKYKSEYFETYEEALKALKSSHR